MASELYATGTFWFGAVAMATARRTLELVRSTDYLERMKSYGEALRQGLGGLARDRGFALRQTGPAQMPQIMFEDDDDFRLAFAWTQEAVGRGVYLHPWHNMFISAPMAEAELIETLDIAAQAFDALRPRLATLKPHPFIIKRLKLDGTID